MHFFVEDQYQSISEASLFPEQNLNRRFKLISRIDEAHLSNLNKSNIITMRYNLHDLCHRLTGKGGSRREIPVYASPLYIADSTQLADYNW